MRKRDMCMVWAATPVQTVRDGEVVKECVRLRCFRANVQPMSDEQAYRAFGVVGMRAVTLRTPNAPQVEKGDALYLARPEGEEPYGPGEYRVQSVRPLRVGAPAGAGPTEITARGVEDA